MSVDQLGLELVSPQHDVGRVGGVVRVERGALEEEASDGQTGTGIGKTEQQPGKGSSHRRQSVGFQARLLYHRGYESCVAVRRGRCFVEQSSCKCPHCGSRTHVHPTLDAGATSVAARAASGGTASTASSSGPIALNVVITFFSLAVGMVVAFVATAPDYRVTALTIGARHRSAIVLPLFFFPFTYTLWLAFDLLSHKPDERELAEADGRRGSRGRVGAVAANFCRGCLIERLFVVTLVSFEHTHHHS